MICLPLAEKCPTPLRRPRRVAPTLVVLHWTATPALSPGGGDSERMRRWLRRGTGSSTHLVVCRSGLVLQAADVADEWTAHAGRSAWREVTGSVNGVSVGVDLELVGGLRAKVGGGWIDAYDRHHRGDAQHYPGAGWFEPMSEAQEASLWRVLRALRELAPTLREVVRHCDVSPGRKPDTGPVVDMARANDELMGVRL